LIFFVYLLAEETGEGAGRHWWEAWNEKEEVSWVKWGIPQETEEGTHDEHSQNSCFVELLLARINIAFSQFIYQNVCVKQFVTESAA